eukprot:TRINITY_DN45069_c0_g1_i1.p1 TRINITY_DN45069_c0_g1~~TRINITY_DN45069_c0_g1_i1.p1  ORF type:complete len:295 (+),score=108.54 TRINITY_DN45069_c0_g1_i1:83-886(+)
MAGESAAAEIEKKIRAVNKKLKQIEGLKAKSSEQLDDAAREKIDSERMLRKELAQLEDLARRGGKPPEASIQQEEKRVEQEKEKEKEQGPAAEEAPAEKEPELPQEQKEKLIRTLKKKLQQIEKLKEKGLEGLDAEAKQKVQNEPNLLAELAVLEGRAPEKAASGGSQNGYPQAAAPSKDDLAKRRAQALEQPPADLTLLLDEEIEKRFKALQKKLRDIGKLREKDKTDKLQQEKIQQEPQVIKELLEIHEKAHAKMQGRREARQAS